MNVTAFICKHHIAVSKWDTHNKKTPCGLSFPTTVIQVIDLCFKRIMTRANPSTYPQLGPSSGSHSCGWVL